MNAYEEQGFKCIQKAIKEDMVIDRLLDKLNREEMDLICDSLINALNTKCDEFCNRLFDELIAHGIDHNRRSRWQEIQAYLENYTY